MENPHKPLSLLDLPGGAKIRLLPDDRPKPYNGVFMMAYSDLKIMHPKSVIKVADESCVYKLSHPPKLRINAREIIGCTLPDIPYSRHRSKRVLKKLRKRLSTHVYGNPLILTLPSKIVEALNGLAKRKPKRASQRDILDQFEFSCLAD